MHVQVPIRHGLNVHKMFIYVAFDELNIEGEKLEVSHLPTSEAHMRTIILYHG